MLKRNLFLLLFLSLSSVIQSNACEFVMNDFQNEINTYLEEKKIKEFNGGYYVDASLLSLQEDGIHLIWGDKDVLIPFMYHDTIGYFLSRKACYDLGTEWLCCRCNFKNDWLDRICDRCKSTRCGR